MKFWARGQTTCSGKGEPAGGRCRQIRRRLADSLLERLGPEAPWVQRHVSHCPRCQRRLAAIGKVDLALSLIKSQPQRLDLLKHANTAALRMLGHSLREAKEAQRLEKTQSEPGLIERCARYRISATHLAACIAILFLTKAGIFSSVNKAHARGEEVLKQYYSTQVGEDMAREVFGA
jgi:hypothetical protein